MSYLPRRGCGLSPEDSEREKILNRESMDDEGFDLPTIDNTDTLEHWLYPLLSIPTSAYEHWNTGFILYSPSPRPHTNTGTLALSFTLHHVHVRTLAYWLYPLLSTTSAYEHWNTGFVLYSPPRPHTKRTHHL